MSIAIYSNGDKVEIPACTAQDIYSTEEQVVGRWIDGKPVYRKVISFTAPGGDIRIPLGSEVSALVNVYGYLDNGDFLIPFPMFAGSLTYFSAFFLFKSGEIVFRAVEGGYSGLPGIAVIEYTKPTDQATVELPAALTAAPAQVLYKAAPQSAAAVTLDAGIRTEEV